MAEALSAVGIETLILGSGNRDRAKFILSFPGRNGAGDGPISTVAEFMLSVLVSGVVGNAAYEGLKQLVRKLAKGPVEDKSLGDREAALWGVRDDRAPVRGDC